MRSSLLSFVGIAIAAASLVSAAPTEASIAKRQCPVSSTPPPPPPPSSSAPPPPPSSTPAPPPPSSSAPPPPVSTPGTGSGGGGGGNGTSAGAPHFSVYSDIWMGQSAYPQAGDLKGWNAFYLSFWLSAGAADNALGWTQFDDPTRQSIKAQFTQAGVKLMVSAFGATETPTSSKDDPVATANSLAAFVKQYGFDGVDVDYEDLNAFDTGAGAEEWLITFTQTLRQALPQGQYILTHAPLAPWFSPGSKWQGGGYLKVHQAVGSMIDWYNIQFYNQGVTEYTTCDGLFNKSSDTWPQTSVFEMIANGVDASKIVVGKPGNTGDANNGYIDPATLAGCVATAAGQGWNGGIMSWQWPHADSTWITTVRGSTF